MTALDFAIVGIIAVSAIFSLFRGFLKEVISLAAWLLAFAVAFLLGPQFSELMPASIENPILRLGTAVAVLFITSDRVIVITTSSASTKTGERPAESVRMPSAIRAVPPVD